MNIVKKEDSITDWIKKVILKYCPIVEDRLFITDDARKTPELEINIDIDKSKTSISFLFGKQSLKYSLVERANLNNPIDINEITSLIDFILDDHEWISYLALNNNKLSMGFSINWSEKALQGITCGNITLNISFNNIEIAKEYITEIVQKYKNNITNSSTNIIINNKKVKQFYQKPVNYD